MRDQYKRKAELAQIHMGAAALGWDGDEYRAQLRRVTGADSAGVLDDAGRAAMLGHMAKCGWVAGKLRRKTQRAPLTPPQKKMWSLWQQLADAGLIANRRMPALVAFAARQTGVDKLEWLNGAQEDLVIESLKRFLSRKQMPEPPSDVTGARDA